MRERMRSSCLLGCIIIKNFITFFIFLFVSYCIIIFPQSLSHSSLLTVVDLKRFQVNARDGRSDTNALAKWRILNRLHDRNETMYYKVSFKYLTRHFVLVCSHIVVKSFQMHHKLHLHCCLKELSAFLQEKLIVLQFFNSFKCILHN